MRTLLNGLRLGAFLSLFFSSKIITAQSCNIIVPASGTITYTSGDTACLTGDFFGTITVENGAVLKLCAPSIDYNGTLSVNSGGLFVMGSGTTMNLKWDAQLLFYASNSLRFTGDNSCPAYINGNDGANTDGDINSVNTSLATPDTNIWINSNTYGNMGNAKNVAAAPAACASPVDCDIQCLDVSTSAPSGPICADDSVNLTALVVTTEPGTWSIQSGPVGGSITGGFFKAQTGGSYVVRYTISGIPMGQCPTYSEQTITVNALPSIDLGGDQTICADDSVTLNAGAGMTTYEWNGVVGLQTLIIKNAGMYKAMITDGNGCVNADSMNLSVDTLPIFSVRSDTTICTGDQLDYSAPFAIGYSYSWSHGDNDANISVTNTNTYVLTITDGNGCSNMDSFQLDLFILPTVNLGADLDLCTGDSVLVDASGDPTITDYLWSTLEISETIWVKAGGSYDVSVTDGNTCQNTDQITIAEHEKPQPNLGPDFSICADGTQTLDPNVQIVGATYQWGPGNETSNTLTIDSSNTYWVVVSTALCSDSDSITVTIEPDPIIILENPGITDTIPSCFYYGLSDTAKIETSQGTITWTGFGNEILEGFKVTAEGWVIAEAENALGCTAQDSLYYAVGCQKFDLKLPTIFTPNNDGFNDNYTIIEIPGISMDFINSVLEIKKTTIYNRWGQVVYSNTNELPNWDGMINGSLASVGTYFVVFEYEDYEGEEGALSTFFLLQQ